MEALKKRSVLSYFVNIISMIGALLAIGAALMIVVFLVYEAVRGVDNPYLEIIVFFILPGGIVAGLALVVIGALWVRYRIRKTHDDTIPPMPRIDLNDPKKLMLTMFFGVASLGFVAIIAIASIQGIHFTESPAFCGELCHPPMEPEHVAWQQSPHAKVRCVECHVGEGVKYFLLAKLNGTKQLVGILTGHYPTPIETPIHNLRPARETCQHCHWPEKFFSARQKIFAHNAPNEENTRRETQLLIKIGGTPSAPNASGIHWHINQEVSYVARDFKRLDIPYIAVKGKDGKIVEYMDTEKPISKEDLANKERRLMDCMDCHNRPAHVFHPPNHELDNYFAAGKLDPSLPYVKKLGMDLLSRKYKNKAEGIAAISKEVKEFYAKNYPALVTSKAESIKQAGESILQIYERNFFPEMKLSWDTYPNHIGHFYFPGCFRCHDGKHKNAEGKVISKDCNLCHTMISQIQENVPKGSQVKQFVHPVDIGDEIMKTNCSECHNPGGSEPAAEPKKH